MPKKPKDPSTKVEERWVEWSDLEAGVNLKAGHPVILFLGGVAPGANPTTRAPSDPGSVTTQPGAPDGTTTKPPKDEPDAPTTTTSGGSPDITTTDTPPTPATTQPGDPTPATTQPNDPPPATTQPYDPPPATTQPGDPPAATTSGPATTTTNSSNGPKTTTTIDPSGPPTTTTSNSNNPKTTTTIDPNGPPTTTTPPPGTNTTSGPPTTTTPPPGTITTSGPPTTTTAPPATTTHPPTTTTKKPDTQFVKFTAEHFDTAKSFPLPAAGKTIKNFQTIAGIANGDSTVQILVLGHTDTQAGDTYNMQLSKERATSIKQYLVNDNNSWYAWYGNADAQKKWGIREDQWMLNSLPYGADGSPPTTPYYNRDVTGTINAEYKQALQAFQGAVGEPATGTANKSTRLKLILAYMKAEGTSVPASTTIQMQGCGFRNQATGQNDGPGVDNPVNRRVEVFLFKGPVTPDASAWVKDNKGTYAAWLKTLPDGVYDDSM